MSISAVTANRAVFVLSLLGSAVAVYLTLAHMSFVDIACGQMAGCEEVAAHPASRGFGIHGLEYVPTAAFGLGAYLSLAALSFLRAAAGSPAVRRSVARAQWALALTGVGVSAYLTYLEAYVIHAFCQWCVTSAVVMVLVFITLSLGREPSEGVSTG